MDIELCIHYNIVTIWFLFIIQSINIPPSAHTIISSAHCSTLQPSAAYSHYIFSVHTTAAITSSVYIPQQPLHLQCTLQHTAILCSLQPNIQCTLQHTATLCSLQPNIQCTHYSSHYIFSAHCNHVQPCAAICSQSSVHTVTTLSDANTIQCI